MTKEEFKAQLVLFFINTQGNLPSKEDMAELQKVVDFTFNGE